MFGMFFCTFLSTFCNFFAISLQLFCIFFAIVVNARPDNINPENISKTSRNSTYRDPTGQFFCRTWKPDRMYIINYLSSHIEESPWCHDSRAPEATTLLEPPPRGLALYIHMCSFFFRSLPAASRELTTYEQIPNNYEVNFTKGATLMWSGIGWHNQIILNIGIFARHWHKYECKQNNAWKYIYLFFNKKIIPYSVKWRNLVCQMVPFASQRKGTRKPR